MNGNTQACSRHNGNLDFNIPKIVPIKTNEPQSRTTSGKTMIIKILGAGCSKCKLLEARVRELVSKNNIPATVEKVTEIQDIMSYGILSTPGLVINEKVKSSGNVPKDEQILHWISEA
jgi:small redox-active disulfide protein 2